MKSHLRPEGICLQGPPDNGALNAVTPLVLHDQSNQVFALTLGNYDEDYPSIHDPSTPFLVGPLNHAQLAAIPEPASLGLTALALAALLGYARRPRG